MNGIGLLIIQGVQKLPEKTHSDHDCRITDLEARSRKNLTDFRQRPTFSEFQCVVFLVCYTSGILSLASEFY